MRTTTNGASARSVPKKDAAIFTTFDHAHTRLIHLSTEFNDLVVTEPTPNGIAEMEQALTDMNAVLAHMRSFARVT